MKVNNPIAITAIQKQALVNVSGQIYKSSDRG